MDAKAFVIGMGKAFYNTLQSKESTPIKNSKYWRFYLDCEPLLYAASKLYRQKYKEPMPRIRTIYKPPANNK